VSAEEYLLQCQRYIEMNPVRAGMVNAPGDYKWSSFRANGLAKPARLWTPHEVYCNLGRNPHECAKVYRELFRGHMDMKFITQIRESTNMGLALGNDMFRQEIEQLTGRRVHALKRGP
jgi:putative transposase